MSISFKEFMQEAAVGEQLKAQPISIHEAVKILKSECSGSLEFFKRDLSFYKGFGIAPFNLEVCNLVDTNLTTRKSENTTNHYTLLLDYVARENNFPLRSKSLVGTSNIHVAYDYSVDDEPVILVPFNSAKIGFANKTDIWGTRLRIHWMNLPISIEELNTLLTYLGIKGNSISDIKDGLKKFGDEGSRHFFEFVYAIAVHFEYFKVKSPVSSHETSLPFERPAYGEDVYSILSDGEKKIIKAAANNLFNDITFAIEHASLGMSFKTGSELAASDFTKNSEIWIQGKVLMLPLSYRKDIQVEL